MTGFQEHALISALERISERDPCPFTNNPMDCNYGGRWLQNIPCLGCIARAALKTIHDEVTS